MREPALSGDLVAQRLPIPLRVGVVEIDALVAAGEAHRVAPRALRHVHRVHAIREFARLTVMREERIELGIGNVDRALFSRQIDTVAADEVNAVRPSAYPPRAPDAARGLLPAELIDGRVRACRYAN